MTLTRNKKIGIAAGVAGLAIVLGILTAIFLANSVRDAAPDETETPKATSTASASIGGGSGGVGTGDDGASVDTSEIPAEQVSEGGTGVGPELNFNADGETLEGDSLDGPVLPVEELAQIRSFRDVAEAAVKEYATVNPAESADARAARLAPYFPEGSEPLYKAPRIANPQNKIGITGEVRVTNKPSSNSYPAITDSTFTFTVMQSVIGTYTTSAGSVTQIAYDQKSWTVTMNRAFDGKVETITEPVFER